MVLFYEFCPPRYAVFGGIFWLSPLFQKNLKKYIFFFSSTHLWKAFQSMFKFYMYLGNAKESKTLKLFMSKKKFQIFCFPLNNLTSLKFCESFFYVCQKQPKFLGNRQYGPKMFFYVKKYQQRYIIVFNLNKRPIEQKLYILKSTHVQTYLLLTEKSPTVGFKINSSQKQKLGEKCCDKKTGKSTSRMRDLLQNILQLVKIPPMKCTLSKNQMISFGKNPSLSCLVGMTAKFLKPAGM